MFPLGCFQRGGCGCHGRPRKRSEPLNHVSFVFPRGGLMFAPVHFVFRLLQFSPLMLRRPSVRFEGSFLPFRENAFSSSFFFLCPVSGASCASGVFQVARRVLSPLVFVRFLASHCFCSRCCLFRPAPISRRCIL